MYTYIYIYICIPDQGGRAVVRGGRLAPRALSDEQRPSIYREFRDVVSEDVVFDNNTNYFQFKYYYTYV